jgi:hypothetical protein
MNFTDRLKSNKKKDVATIKTAVKERLITENKQTPEEILRGAGLKIKLVVGTSFGTQIDFAKKYKDDDIEELLTDFTIKIKDKSVFIVD